MSRVVLFLGAGFSKVSGLKTTNELAGAFVALEPTRATPDPQIQAAVSNILAGFWRDVFGWEPGSGERNPSLEDHFTLVDLAANTGHAIGCYTPRKLRAIRRFSIHRIYDILDQGFVRCREVDQLLQRINGPRKGSIITTNWDTAVERYLADGNIKYNYGVRTNYVYGGSGNKNGVTLAKLHGSSNWMYCDSCRRIYTGRPGCGKATLHSLTLLRQEDLEAFVDRDDNTIKIGNHDRYPCKTCKIELSTRVATFSFAKAMGFFQFQSVWDAALMKLQEAQRWLFIGYSLPQADYEIRSLLKAAQFSSRKSGEIEIVAVVGHDVEAENSYKRFFGSRVNVYRQDFREWWNSTGQNWIT